MKNVCSVNHVSSNSHCCSFQFPSFFSRSSVSVAGRYWIRTSSSQTNRCFKITLIIYIDAKMRTRVRAVVCFWMSFIHTHYVWWLQIHCKINDGISSTKYLHMPNPCPDFPLFATHQHINLLMNYIRLHKFQSSCKQFSHETICNTR